MKSLSCFAVPAGLAVAAALLNALALNSQIQPVDVVSAARSLPAGTRLTESDLKPITLHYPSQSLRQYFWTWEERSQVIGKRIATEQPAALLPRTAFHKPSTVLEAPPNGIILGVRCPQAAFDKGSTVNSLIGTRVIIEAEDLLTPELEVVGCRIHRSEDDTVVSIFLLVPSGVELNSDAICSQKILRVSRQTDPS